MSTKQKDRFNRIYKEKEKKTQTPKPQSTSLLKFCLIPGIPISPNLHINVIKLQILTQKYQKIHSTTNGQREAQRRDKNVR